MKEQLQSPAKSTGSPKAVFQRVGPPILLVLGGCLVALGFAELCLRTVIHVPDDLDRRIAAAAPVEDLTTVEYAAQYVTTGGLPESVDSKWFFDDPPPLPNRTPVAKELQDRYDDYVRRGLYGPQSGYLWNPAFIYERGCVSKSGMFAHYPDFIEEFDPPDKTQFPRFRFLPDRTLPSGLVVNAFGLRGPEIPLRKGARTVRIAFVGASTTVDSHNYLASYPEWTVHWLNRLSNARRWDVTFEVMNSGREGIGSTDIAAIVKQELIPLDPDLIVYMEGANQFPSANQMVSPRIPPRTAYDPLHPLPDWWRKRFALARLLDRVIATKFGMLDEPHKPSYRLIWPAGAEGPTINVDSRDLPLDLPTVRKDLDSIKDAVHRYGTDLAVSSFVWLAHPGMRLSRDKQRYIYQELNSLLWPLTYADIQKLSNYQNQFFQQYARSRGAYFLDFAKLMPRDVNLFVDAVHMTEAGVRLKGWVQFKLLIPLVEAKIRSGEWPRQSRTDLPPPPSLAHHTVKMQCRS